MPEFRPVVEIDGIPSSIRPGDARFGSAVGAAPVTSDGETLTVSDHLAGKASLDPGTGKLRTDQTDLSKGGDYQVALGLPAILTIAQEVKARGVVPAARLGITGGTADQTTSWQTAIGDALLTYKRPVELNLGLSHRVGSRLRFPAGSGIVNPGGASVTADCADFNNTSFDVNARYGTNAVILSGTQGAAGVRFEGVKLTLTAANAAAFKEKRVQGIVLIGCPDAVITDADLSGFNAGTLINIQSCKGFRLTRPYCHDSVVHSASTSKVACQLTGILVDGDELLDSQGNRIGSRGRIEFPRVINMRSTAEVVANVTDQTDGINVAGIGAEVFILYPHLENVAEPLDTFGRVQMEGGRIINAGNFAVKIVHGGQGCLIRGFTAENVGIAGVVMQSTSSEPRGISGNEIRGALKNVGTLNTPELTVNGATSPATTTPPAAPGDTYEVLLVDTNATYPVEKNFVEVDVSGSTRSTNPIRVTTNGAGNVVRYTNRDGTTDAKSNMLSGANTIRRTDKVTNIRAYASAAQSFPTTTTVVSYPVETSDPFGEWSGTVYTAKFSGTLRVVASLVLGGASASDTLTMTLRQNGVTKRVSVTNSIGGSLSGVVQHNLDVAIGDTIDATGLPTSSLSSTPGEIYTTITLNRLPD